MESNNANSDETYHNCACGKTYSTFYNYKNHLIKNKCVSNPPTTPQIPPDLPQTIQEPHNLELQNTNTNSDNIPNPEPETIELGIKEQQLGKIAYKTSTPNANPKTLCNYCDKLYSKHHIKSHKLKCKHKYKDCYEYKLLVRAKIPDIPETYFEVRQLFCRINEENPQIFNNLPQDKTQYDDLESGIPHIGRPKKIINNNQTTTNIGTNNNNTNNINTTNNNITNNIQNNNHLIQQNINIVINPVCHENIAHITPERQMYIILQRLQSFKALIDSLYEVPSNHNIHISDRKGEKVRFLDKEHGINNGGAHNIIGDIAMAHLGHLDNFIEKHKANIPEHRKDDLKFLEAFLIDEQNNPKVISQLNDKVASLSGSSKILLDRFQKQKVIEYINNLPDSSEELLEPDLLLSKFAAKIQAENRYSRIYF